MRNTLRAHFPPARPFSPDVITKNAKSMRFAVKEDTGRSPMASFSQLDASQEIGLTALTAPFEVKAHTFGQFRFIQQPEIQSHAITPAFAANQNPYPPARFQATHEKITQKSEVTGVNMLRCCPIPTVDEDST